MSFRVKALYNYSSEHDDDLKFDEGQIITITDEDDADWYTGEYTDDATGEHRSGLFPRNFVERYEPVTPPRPTKRPQAAAPVPVPAPPSAAEEEPEKELELDEDPGHASNEIEAEEEVEEEEEERHEAAPADDAAPPPLPVMATKPVSQEPRQPPAQAAKPVPPPPAQETVRSPPVRATQPSEPESDSKPVVSSFKDRIAAFNRGGAAPVAPPKPGGLGGASGSSGFVKKAYVAPPPSRNAYVPPSTQAPIAKIYRREEDPDLKSEDRAPPPPPERSEDTEEDQPKPMSLKERMAMLQKQQLEQQAKHAEAVAKKAKPKPPPKKSSGASQPPIPEATMDESVPMEPPTRVLSDDSIRPEPLASPEKEDTTDHLTVEGEELMSSSIQSIEPPKSAAPVGEVDRNMAEEMEETEEVEEQGKREEEEEEELDPEIKRRMELRERMAKMSGGMGMGAMFGAPAGFPGMGARKTPKSKATDSSIASDEQIESSSPPSQPIPVMPGMAMPGMALPGMGVPRPKKADPPVEEPEVSREDEDEDEDEPISKLRAPEVVPDIEDVKEHTEDDEDREVQPERSLSPPPQAPPETRPAPPLPPVSAESKRRSMLPPDPALPAAPPVPQRVPEQSESRSLPAAPPPPAQVNSPPLPPNSPPRQSLDQKRNSRLPPPVPGNVETAAYARAPPPPPPAAPPRPSMDGARPAKPEEEQVEDEEDEEDEEEKREDSDYEETDAETHNDELHHAGLPSLGPSTRAPPPPPPGQPPAQAPRSGPPPLPTQPPRQSREFPRGPPPVPPPAMSPTEQDDEYDPFNYQSNPQGVPTGSTSSTPHVEIQQPDLYGASPPTSPLIRTAISPPVPQGPPRQTAPPVPPVELPSQQPPPPPPVTTSSQASPPFTAPQAPPRQAPPPVASPPPPAIQQPSRQSLDLLSKAQSRRSVDVPRPSGEHDYIAQDVDLGRESNWWSLRRSPPPVFQNRGDVSIEYDESTTVQNDGHALTAKHVYVLFMDYSQTIVTAYYSQDNPTAGAEFQQRHEPPPARLREDQLEAAHARFGAKLAAAAKSKENHAVADGSALSFVQELVRTVTPEALGPVGTRAFGAAVYANMANASVTQSDHIRAGDVVSFRNAKLQGHRGGLKQKYALDLAAHVGFVLDWDGTKQKVRIYEQNGKKVKVESYKLGDLKTGEVKIWRVMSREWVGWGSTG